MQIAVRKVTQACLSSDNGDLDASGVRVKLLEVAVRPTAQWRRLAFTLLLNSSAASLAALLSVQEDSSIVQTQKLEMNLFKVLREMLSKAVVVSTTSLVKEPTAVNIQHSNHSSDWVELAVGCLELFVKKSNGSYSSDRLRALDEHTLLFLVAEASNRGACGSDLQQKALEIIVATMYAFKVVPGGKAAATERQNPTKDHTVWNCGLPLAVVEQYISTEVLLYHFYNSPVARTQRLICMVLVDLACEQMRRTGSREAINIAGLEQVWHAFLVWENPSLHFRQSLLTPYISTARLAKQLSANCPLVPEKHLNGFLNQFRVLAQVEDYFGPNPTLAKAIVAAKKQDNVNMGDILVSQVSKQLHSNRAVERFCGERWLAELLLYGQDDVFSSYGSQADTVSGAARNQAEVFLVRPAAPVGEDLEETFCYDEGGEVGAVAQAKFWELISPSSALGLRVSFPRVLELFVRRKLQHNSGKLDAATIQEINTCLQVIVEHKESEPTVLVPVILLILDVCQCELSYIDKRKQQRDSSSSSCDPLDATYDRVAWSDSLASRVLNGDVALDKTLLHQLHPAFFIHVLQMLHECTKAHPAIKCRRLCCGVGRSLTSDVAACTAFIVMQILSDNDTAFAKVGGLSALTPLLQACDTRISVFMAKLVGVKIKQADKTQYSIFLRELYVACVEADDESALYNSYLHAQTLLHNFHDNEVGVV
ncbi:hypothetical protein PHYBOEH_012051 [Phytophthora boehmeriae]|uniref:Uncharacterized protein n=1 Tax=Phytophthora boehmeriae TaxID=109152 RepID=A0A8T1X2B3_9STRA|nr:hypothetical protein PHYBOEH_012051 [Phytophthora boehmeriae]